MTVQLMVCPVHGAVSFTGLRCPRDAKPEPDAVPCALKLKPALYAPVEPR